VSPEPVSPWPHADNCVPQMCTEWTAPPPVPPCSIGNHGACAEMPSAHGTIGNPPSGGALTADPHSPIGEALTQHSASTAVTSDIHTATPVAAGVVTAVVLVVAGVLTAALAWRKRHVTSPTVPAGMEQSDA
jgi:hypothetical protein